MLSSPFQNILHTNTVPSDAECDSIRAFLKTPSEKLAVLETEVQRLRGLLEEALHTQDELQAFIHEHEALLSPVRRVPDDVLRTIFIHVLPDTRNTTFSATEGPLLLSRVCRAWMELARTTPRLWSSMHIVIPQADDAPTSLVLRRTMDRWLGNSGAVPLSVSTHRQIKYASNLVSPPPLAFLPLLLPVASRWGHMQLALHRLEDLTALSHLQKEDVPVLRGVELSLEHSFPAPFATDSAAQELELPAQMQLDFLATKNLRSFSFRGAHACLPQTIAWDRLLVLKLDLVSRVPANGQLLRLDFPFSFLRRCTTLETLHIAIRNYRILYDLADVETFHLHQLQSLKLDMHPQRLQLAVSRNPLRLILNWIYAPRLHTLELSEKLCGDLVDTLHNYHDIRHLTLHIDDISSQQLLSGLAGLQVLEHLRLHGEPFIHQRPRPKDGELLAAFIPAGSTGTTLTLCPALKYLEMSKVQSPSDALIVRFIEARTSPAAERHNLTPLSGFNHLNLGEAQFDVRGEPTVARAISQSFKLRLIYMRRIPRRMDQYSVSERPPGASVHSYDSCGWIDREAGIYYP
ncbi:hypothetical protein C8F01DRAFT_1145946 [Mycena amicta]|nr:hypothetical protein C8F01DRAFT_1145946 [Mycena amicta]